MDSIRQRPEPRPRPASLTIPPIADIELPGGADWRE
jgi:hypothetical protein